MWGIATMLAGASFALVACGSHDGAGDVDDSAAAPSASAPAPGGPAAFGPGSSGAPKACRSDADCADQDACTTDVCEPTRDGEFTTRACSHAAVPGCAPSSPSSPPSSDGASKPDAPVDDPSAAVDAACASGNHVPVNAVFLPFVPLQSPSLPASCGGGFEWQNCSTHFVKQAIAPSGATGGTLFVDLATYTMPDRLRIVGVDANGASYTLLDTCRVRTANYSDPTDGKSRPPDDSIRQFELHVLPGTKSLEFDATQGNTPWYMRIVGLCDFDGTQPAACHYRGV